MSESPLKPELREGGILFALRGEELPLFGLTLGGPGSGRLLEARGLSPATALALANRLEPSFFPHGALIDLGFLSARAAEEAAALGRELGSEELKDLAALSRIKLQGTDGMRGRASSGELGYREALRLFLREGCLAPAFLRLSAEALGRRCLAAGLASPGGRVVVGADGRDPSGRFSGAVAAGFSSLGLEVLDAGVIPTPGVPLYAAYAGARLGAIVTASHNPSNQNGVKYVHDGFKLPNDGPAGEYGLSAAIFALADEEGSAASAAPRPAPCPAPLVAAREVGADASELLFRVDLDNAGLEPGTLGGLRIVYDGANGAYSGLACRVLEALGADYRAVNVEPRGSNINQGGGVGEIEGHASFEGSAPLDASLASVAALFEEGRRAAPGKRVYGIVNDGDGDRGYLLVYEAAGDRVHVVPGDEVAYWIARGRKEEGSLGEEPVCVNSVESEILAGRYMEVLLGLRSETACVGDKNLLKPAREGRNHIVGCEESGHVTFGVELQGMDGLPRRVYTGNGLLSVLRAISVIEATGAGLEEAAHPFPPGLKDCRYVYFVDKSRFYRGSPAWRGDEAAALAILERELPEGYRARRLDFPDDPEMLYLACLDPAGLKEGALFVRNSGTELKSSVTIRCTEALGSAMGKAMEAVHRLNARLLKDESLREARAERLLLELLASGRGGPAEPSSGELGSAELRAALESRLGEAFPEADFAALRFAMRKEGLLGDSAATLSSPASRPCS